MADTPITPIPQDEQNLDINLEENTPITEKQPETWNLWPETNTDIDLNLDLNLPEAEKTDDRLKKEDENIQQPETIMEDIPEISKEPSQETTPPTVEELFAEAPNTKEPTKDIESEKKEISNPFVPKAEMPDIPTDELFVSSTEEPKTNIQLDTIPQIETPEEVSTTASEETSEEVSLPETTHTTEEAPIQEMEPSSTIQKIETSVFSFFIPP